MGRAPAGTHTGSQKGSEKWRSVVLTFLSRCCMDVQNTTYGGSSNHEAKVQLVALCIGNHCFLEFECAANFDRYAPLGADPRFPAAIGTAGAPSGDHARVSRATTG